jgi:antitoxin (DNA-binding transcriptional repressor) of toxin-antitoxin stability system
MVILSSYHMAMKSVNIAELKNRLSHYLRLVRRGESILVRDRDAVIARIEPAGGIGAGEGDEERLASLEQRGVLRRARVRWSRKILSRRPRIDADVVDAILREREESR